MEWDADKLNAFMKHFGVSANQIAKSSGIPYTTIYNLKYGAYEFDKYHDRLTAYMNALKDAKKAEYETMLNYYLKFGS